MLRDNCPAQGAHGSAWERTCTRGFEPRRREGRKGREARGHEGRVRREGAEPEGAGGTGEGLVGAFCPCCFALIMARITVTNNSGHPLGGLPFRAGIRTPIKSSKDQPAETPTELSAQNWPAMPCQMGDSQSPANSHTGEFRRTISEVLTPGQARPRPTSRVATSRIRSPSRCVHGNR